MHIREPLCIHIVVYRFRTNFVSNNWLISLKHWSIVCLLTLIVQLVLFYGKVFYVPMASNVTIALVVVVVFAMMFFHWSVDTVMLMTRDEVSMSSPFFSACRWWRHLVTQRIVMAEYHLFISTANFAPSQQMRGV